MSDDMTDMPMDMGPSAPPAPVDAAPKGTGLGTSFNGFVYSPARQSTPADVPGAFSFHIKGPDGRALTRYQPYESKLVVFYLIRSDLTDYQLLDPAMREDGTWTVGLPALRPGSYRSYVTFAAPDASQGTPEVYALSAPLTVPGTAANAAIPAPTPTSATDGYDLALSGRLTSGTSLALSVDITKGGISVPYFQPYLDGYAHLAAFRVGDGAFAHVLSTGRTGGPGGVGPLTARTLFPESGTWRLFVQFNGGSTLHTAAFTVHVA
jgi:hypothetical protein